MPTDPRCNARRVLTTKRPDGRGKRAGQEVDAFLPAGPPLRQQPQSFSFLVLLFCFSFPDSTFADDTPAGQMSGRVGTSLLASLGVPELSFHSVKELEDAAVLLAQSPGKLSALRKRRERQDGWS